MINMEYLEKVEAWIRSGDLEADFGFSPDERRFEMLEFLEKLIEIGEMADAAATRILMKNITGQGATPGE